MNAQELNTEFRGMDIYLLDQILKGRFTPGTKILDAGFGGGRNLFWFLKNGFAVYGIDQREKSVELVREEVAVIGKNPAHFSLGTLENLPFENSEFDGVLCNAVLHFAKSPEHFAEMFAELVRVLAPNGTLFLRMTSNIGIADLLDVGTQGVYLLPDGKHRFLLTKALLSEIMHTHQLKFLEPLKTVNVNDIRCMSTLVLTHRLH